MPVSFVEYLGDFGFFEGGHNAYEDLGCYIKRIILFFAKESSIIIDFIKITKPLTSLLYNLQFSKGSLQQLHENIFMFRNNNTDREVYIKLLGVENIPVAVETGAVFPDYNKSVPAPRIKLIEKEPDNDRMIITLLSSSQSLVESFALNDETILTGSSSSRYCLTIGRNYRVERTGDLTLRLAGVVQKKDEKLIFIRNGNAVVVENILIENT